MPCVNIKIMIHTFKCKETKEIFEGIISQHIQQDIQNVARRKLRMMNNATTLKDLRVPPNNHLEKLHGDRTGQYSIKINDQWRICFRWVEGNCFDVEIVDYH